MTIRRKFVLGLLLSILICYDRTLVNAESELPILKINDGELSGTWGRNQAGTTYMKFLGIPYAKPPVGKRRFAPPQPAESWQGTWIANHSYTCIQVDHYDAPQEGLTKGSEDCLYLNVYVPGTKIDKKKKLDVIVHIHGGGFMFGSANVYANPSYFMDKNVVFVTMNYRLGILGFLSTGDEYLPGNNGMKDQVLALKWIKENIADFGGNPDSVTITGLSAGGASVHFHLLSPLSKGLFHKAISVSGDALAPWAIHEGPKQKAKEVGKAVGCPYTNTKQFLSCLRKRPASQLIEATKLFRIWAYVPFSPFGLVVDNADSKPFLPEHPYQLLVDGKINDVPWVISMTTAEGLYPVSQLVARKEYFKELKDNWDKYIAHTLHYELTVPKAKFNDVGQKIKEFYLGDKEVGEESYTEIIKMASERLFVTSIEQSVRLHAKAIKSPVWFYVYDYSGEKVWSLSELLFGYKDRYGVSHADDVLMIFEQPMKGSAKDQRMTTFLIDFWVNFAKTGKPKVQKWKTVSKNMKDPLDYLFIASPDDMKMEQTNDLGNKEFWSSLPLAENERLVNYYLKDEL